MSLIETDQEDCVEPVISLRDGDQVMVVNQADRDKLYRIIKLSNGGVIELPVGCIIMIPYHIITVNASAGGPDQQKYNATTISPSLVKEGIDSSQYG